MFSFNSWTRFLSIASICGAGLCIPAQWKNMPLHLGCNFHAGSGLGRFNAGKWPLQNGKRLTWCIFFHFCIKKLPIFLQNIQSRDGGTRVTPQWRGRPEAVLLKKGPSRSWRRKLRASAGALNRVFWAAQWYVGLIPFWIEGFGWFWYLVIAVNRVIHGDSRIPRKFLGSMSPNLDGCPPKKLAVWCDSWFVWDSLHFHGYCWENFSL